MISVLFSIFDGVSDKTISSPQSLTITEHSDGSKSGYVSATLTFSGVKPEDNMKVASYQAGGDNTSSKFTGVVFDPESVDVAHACFTAGFSGGKVGPIKMRRELQTSFSSRDKHQPCDVQAGFLTAPHYDKWDSETQQLSHIPGLKQFTKNLKKRQLDAQERNNPYAYDVYGGYYYDGHSGGCFYTNEVLVANPKPIGLFIDISAFKHDEQRTRASVKQELQNVIQLLRQNPHLHLYVYNTDAETDIVRYCGNQKGLKILGQAIRGFSSPIHVLRQSFEGLYSLEDALPELPKKGRSLPMWNSKFYKVACL